MYSMRRTCSFACRHFLTDTHQRLMTVRLREAAIGWVISGIVGPLLAGCDNFQLWTTQRMRIHGELPPTLFGRWQEAALRRLT